MPHKKSAKKKSKALYTHLRHQRAQQARGGLERRSGQLGIDHDGTGAGHHGIPTQRLMFRCFGIDLVAGYAFEFRRTAGAVQRREQSDKTAHRVTNQNVRRQLRSVGELGTKLRVHQTHELVQIVNHCLSMIHGDRNLIDRVKSHLEVTQRLKSYANHD